MALRTNLLLVCLGSVAATAPAAASELDLSLPASTAPIGFGNPAGTPPSALPAGSYDRAGLDTAKRDDGFDVSGSVSTGIGYSKGYGSSTFSHAHLRVSKDVGDERPSRVTVDISVGTSRGPGFGGYGYGYGYGGYGYGHDHGYGYGYGYGDGR
ncbi:MAG: hypothetical protein ACREO8_06505 [Luteimonas sp.]